MPGQSIRIVISYVETLKYEERFLRVVVPDGCWPTYITRKCRRTHHRPEQIRKMTPHAFLLPRAPEGVRAGHDISLEIDLDAGVPIVAVNSETHETEVQQSTRSVRWCV
jgi:Ca-activated chloride channel family protein